MEKHFIYKFLDKNKNIIYVGRTSNINKRLNQHFSSAGHLEKHVYKKTNSVLYAIVDNLNEAIIYEIYYISKHQPKFNNKIKNDGIINVSLDDLHFERAVSRFNNGNKKFYCDLNKKRKFKRLKKEYEYEKTKHEQNIVGTKLVKLSDGQIVQSYIYK